MIAISDKLRHQVMKLAEQYEKPEFITDDPVQFPRRFGYKCSQEIVGFIAAWLAYGNRKAILSTCEKLCKEMERLTPYMYIKNMGWRKYIDSEEPLYRFFKEKDFADLCRALKEIYDNNEDMEEALSKNYTRTMGATDYLDALISLFPGVKGIPQDSKSACKRLNIFLRWKSSRIAFIQYIHFKSKDMLIFIKSWITPPQDSPSKESLVEVQKAYRVENIKEVSEVNALTNPKGKFRFSILLVTGERLYSSLYGTKEEAEMAQVSAITVLNAIELYFERFKHVPEHHATPVMFQAPDAKQKKLVPGKISMFDTPVYTIQI